MRQGKKKESERNHKNLSVKANATRRGLSLYENKHSNGYSNGYQKTGKEENTRERAGRRFGTQEGV